MEGPDKRTEYKVAYIDPGVIVVEKPQGLSCEPFSGDNDSLIEAVRRDLDPGACLCHRLDRNTGGLVIIARNPKMLELFEKAHTERTVKKTYEAVVIGNAFEKFGDGRKFISKKAYHFKDAKLGMVYIYDNPRKLARPIETLVRPVSYDPANNTTVVDVMLVTGRTHQIRAHLAHLGFPVAGDGKYGRNAVNRKLGYKYQALWAKKIELEDSLAKAAGMPKVIRSVPDFERTRGKG